MMLYCGLNYSENNSKTKNADKHDKIDGAFVPTKWYDAPYHGVLENCINQLLLGLWASKARIA
jgi:hypothetical protein